MCKLDFVKQLSSLLDLIFHAGNKFRANNSE